MTIAPYAKWTPEGRVIVEGRTAACDYRIIDRLDGSGPQIERWQARPKHTPPEPTKQARPCTNCSAAIPPGRSRCPHCSCASCGG